MMAKFHNFEVMMINLDVSKLSTVYAKRAVDGMELIEVSVSTYLPRPTCFHLINIYGEVGPAAVVVKLDLPSHAIHLNLPRGTDRHTERHTHRQTHTQTQRQTHRHAQGNV